MDLLQTEPCGSRDNAQVTTSDDDITYDGWMSNLCDEPSDDAGTCCLGFWLPCLLYGKVDQRIKLVRDGKNPEDAGTGCGAECLIWQVTLGGFGGKLWQLASMPSILCPCHKPRGSMLN